MTAPIGHDEAATAFMAAVASGRLHHAWLIAGPEGIGKATFAKAAARWLLAGGPAGETPLEVAPEAPAARLIEAGAHPDHRLIEREAWKGDVIIPSADRGDGDRPARNIRIAQIRALRQFLTTKPGLAAHRAVIVDAIDDLERGAANALLKSLEEPPANTIFLLVSHAPDRLLPTIRSRCRMLRLAPLDDAAMRRVLAAALPDAPAEEIAALARAGGGSPGRASAMAGLDVAGLDETMDRLAADGDPGNRRRAALAQALSSKAAQPRYESFLDRAPSRIAAAARGRRGPALAAALALHARATDLAGGALRLSLDPYAVTFELAGMIAALSADGREPG